VHPVVDTVAFIVHREGTILVEQRKLTKKTDPGKVAIPGGHVEKGESFEQACKRELREELDLECSSFSFIIRLLHHTDVEDQMTHYYSCEDWRGEPKSKEAERVFWVDSKHLDVLSFEIDRKAAEEFFKTQATDNSYD
jgi:mutator protein MutT